MDKHSIVEKRADAIKPIDLYTYAPLNPLYSKGLPTNLLIS